MFVAQALCPSDYCLEVLCTCLHSRFPCRSLWRSQLRIGSWGSAPQRKLMAPLIRKVLLMTPHILKSRRHTTAQWLISAWLVDTFCHSTPRQRQSSGSGRGWMHRTILIQRPVMFVLVTSMRFHGTVFYGDQQQERWIRRSGVISMDRVASHLATAKALGSSARLKWLDWLKNITTMRNLFVVGITDIW